MAKIETVHNLSELLASSFYQGFESDKLGNSLFINDPDRASRNFEAAADGCDGSTHQEKIDDMREGNELAERELYRPMFESMGFGDNSPMLAEALCQAVEDEINDCEQWHNKNGSLETVCG